MAAEGEALGEAPRALPLMAATGVSDSWRHSKQNTLRIFERFRKSNTLAQRTFPVPFQDLPEDVLINRSTYMAFAEYITHEYKIEEGSRNAGTFLSCNVLIAHTSTLINIACERFKVT